MVFRWWADGGPTKRTGWERDFRKYDQYEEGFFNIIQTKGHSLLKDLLPFLILSLIKEHSRLCSWRYGDVQSLKLYKGNELI